MMIPTKTGFGGFEKLNSKCRPQRAPLRTTAEMAEEFGISSQKLAALIVARNGPTAKYRIHTKSSKNTWHEPKKLREWWKSIHDEDGSLKPVGE